MREIICHRYKSTSRNGGSPKSLKLPTFNRPAVTFPEGHRADRAGHPILRAIPGRETGGSPGRQRVRGPSPTRAPVTSVAGRRARFRALHAHASSRSVEPDDVDVIRRFFVASDIKKFGSSISFNPHGFCEGGSSTFDSKFEPQSSAVWEC